MHILFVNESLGGGGAERQLGLIVDALVADGHEIAFATWASDEVPDVYLLPASVRRIHLRQREITGGRLSRLRQHLRAFTRLARHMRGTRYDAVVSFSEASNILTVLAGKITSSPTVVSIRVSPEEMFRQKPAWRGPATWAYARADAVVVQTDAAAAWCHSNCGRPAVVIPNVLRSLPPPLPDAEREPLIVSAGRLDMQKGHDLLIRAFASIHPAHPDWRLAILGDGPEGDNLKELAANLGVAERVEFRGFTADIELALNAARIFAFPSRFEGFPNALIEAMGLGLPCIASDCDFGPRDIVTDGVDGLLIPVEDVSALANALDRLIADRSLREKLSQEARRINDRYTPARVMRLWSNVLHGVRQERG